MDHLLRLECFRLHDIIYILKQYFGKTEKNKYKTKRYDKKGLCCHSLKNQHCDDYFKNTSFFIDRVNDENKYLFFIHAGPLKQT